MQATGRRSSSSPAAVRRSELAPTPTGSSRMGWPSLAASSPAASILSTDQDFMVPRFRHRPPVQAVTSAASEGSSDRMGLAPQASSILATSFAVT